MESLFITVLLLSVYFDAVMTQTRRKNGNTKKTTTKSTTASTRTTTTTISTTTTGTTMSTRTTTTSGTTMSTRTTTTTGTTMSTRVTTTTTTPSLQSSISKSATVSSEKTTASQRTGMSTSAKIRTLSSSGMPVTTTTALKTTQEKTNGLYNITHSTRKSPVTSDDSGTVVVPVVSVFVGVVIILAAVIVFLLWRHRRMMQKKAIGVNSGTSISNRSYEDDHVLERHISLQDMRPDDSVDSGYAEISPANLNVEENSGNVYQTIDNLPEDKTECNSGYGHLKMQTTTIIDNNYSHVAVNQNGKPLSDGTYAHTGNPFNVRELKDDEENETTYNHLETNSRKPQGFQPLLQTDEKERFDDLEAEYNHAKAGQLSLKSDNNGDTYSHLSNTQKPRENQQNDVNILTQVSKTQTFGTKIRNLVSDNDVGRNTFPEYAKCTKKGKERETPKQVGCNGYETPAGVANIYFTLEPESKLADTDVSFQVTNETFEDSESEDSPDHQYFILEKIANDT